MGPVSAKQACELWSQTYQGTTILFLHSLFLFSFLLFSLCGFRKVYIEILLYLWKSMWMAVCSPL